jgi:hypothetical protein
MRLPFRTPWHVFVLLFSLWAAGVVQGRFLIPVRRHIRASKR